MKRRKKTAVSVANCEKNTALAYMGEHTLNWKELIAYILINGNLV